MKKVVFIIYSSLFIHAGSNLSAKIIPLNLSKPPSVSLKQANSTQGQISRLLAAKLKSNISKVYGQHQRRQIYGEVLKIIQATLRHRPANLRMKDLNSPSTWYTNEITYMFYAENFGTRQPGKTNNLHDLLAMIPYLANLGVTNVYILPFVESPLKDGGFDVKNPLIIRPTLGTLNDFQQVVKLLHQNGIKVTADLVLNHLSDQSQWFQQALKGNQQKIDYFLYKNYLPRYIKYFDPRRGVVIDYTNKDGMISSRRLIFPELTPNHYRKEVINHKNYYFYHTFYPFQIDLNWKNPQVLYEMLRVVGFWCNQGIDIFRLDSIPFLVKTEGTSGENLPETHEIISLISTFLQASCPSSVLQAEAGQSPKAILPYFGKE
ncbi:MAG: alpha-amylase family glycosyl hydrolase, partial [Burkholderiales bacterium]